MPSGGACVHVTCSRGSRASPLGVGQRVRGPVRACKRRPTPVARARQRILEQEPAGHAQHAAWLEQLDHPVEVGGLAAKPRVIVNEVIRTIGHPEVLRRLSLDELDPLQQPRILRERAGAADMLLELIDCLNLGGWRRRREPQGAVPETGAKIEHALRT